MKLFRLHATLVALLIPALAAAADRVLELPFDPASFAADILQLTERP